MTTLEDLYYGNISPHERYIKQGTRVDKLVKLICKNEEELNAGLTEKQKETFEIMKELLPGGATDEEMENITVLNWITDVFPPTYCMTSVNDFLKFQGPVLAAKLTENNVPFVYRVFGDKVNMLGHVFHCDVKTVDAAQCNDDECDFFREFCF